MKTLKDHGGIGISRAADSVVLSYDGKPRKLVRSDGSVWSWRYGHNYKQPEFKLCRHQLTKNGYQMMCMAGTQWYVHRVVAELFVPCDTPESLCVNHKDSNKTNQHPDNLEWVTYSENHTHAYANGRPKLYGHRGGGVYYDKSRSKWGARVNRGGKQHYVGRYQTREEADASRDKAFENEYA